MGEDGLLHYVKDGADTVLPFNKGGSYKINSSLNIHTFWRVNSGSPFQVGNLFNTTAILVIEDGKFKSLSGNSGGGSMASFPNNTGSVTTTLSFSSIQEV